jgi:hypothetical protein
VIRARLPPTYGPERRYALEVLLGVPVECEVADVAAIELAVGDDEPVVLAEGLFATPEADWLTPASLPRTPLASVDGVPLLYGTPERPDLLGSAFFCLTRYEELVDATRDERDRYPATASLAFREGFLGRPVADEYAQLLRGLLERRWPRLPWQRHAFSVVPSHDVDHPLATGPRLRPAAAELLRRRDLDGALRRLVRGPRAVDTFDWTMDESERRGLRSAFYFIAGHTGGAIDGDYSLEDPWIRRLLRRIDERGHEIGLHPSHETFRDPEATIAEADRLRRTLDELGIDQERIGGRQHFLRWENPATWRAWEAAGLAYDSSLGYSDRPGFRSGTCREHPVFDLRERRTLALRERPLLVMDVTLVLHLGLGDDETVAAAHELRAEAVRVQGDYTVLWHNNHLASARRRRTYLRVLDG